MELTVACWLQIDNDGELEGGIIKLKATEIVINSIKLRWKDKASGEVREEGKTKPEVVMRQLGSQPGQVGLLWTGDPAHHAATRVREQQNEGTWLLSLCPGWVTSHGRCIRAAFQLPVCASLGSVAVCAVR